MIETFISFVLIFLAQLFGLHTAEVDVPVVAESVQADVLSVTDGDTIRVAIDGVEHVVRYIGIDTSEPYRDVEPACFSAQASERNRALVQGKTVTLVSDTEDTDRYNRLLRYVYVDEVFVNEVLLTEGFATTMTIEPNTQYADQFRTIEQSAQSNGVGLWSACAARAESDGTATAAAEQTTIDPVIITAAALTPTQQRLLEMVGLDETVFVVTQDMISCAEQVVGVERLATIVSGTRPSITESIQLVRCYKP